jgi:hypothetical protein
VKVLKILGAFSKKSTFARVSFLQVSLFVTVYLCGVPFGAAYGIVLV